MKYNGFSEPIQLLEINYHSMSYFSDEKNIYKSSLYFICFAAIGTLTFFVINSPRTFVADEQIFYPNIAYLHDVGIAKFITTYVGQAPGPLYELVHYFTYILFKNILFVRIDNLIFTFLNISLIALILKKREIKNYALISLLYLCVPLSWPNSGIAITETPTIFFALLFFYFLDDAFIRQKVSITSVLILSFCATCAIMGRSTFLTIVLSALAFFLYSWERRKTFLLVICILAMLIPAYVFLLWGGLMPPQQAFLSKGGFSFYHLILMTAYTGIVLLILFPNAITIVCEKYKSFIVIFVLFFLAFIVFKNNILIPMQTVKIAHSEYIKYLIIAVYAATSSFFVLIAFDTFIDEKRDMYVTLFFFLILLMATTLRITDHFSGTYAFQTAPFLILIFRKYFKVNLLQVVLSAIGVIAGIWSLHGYYTFHY